MKRIHLLEFEDQVWFPNIFRNYLTEILHYQITTYKIYAPVVGKIKSVLQQTDCKQIIDLCSGLEAARYFKFKRCSKKKKIIRYLGIDVVERIALCISHRKGTLTSVASKTDLPTSQALAETQRKVEVSVLVNNMLHIGSKPNPRPPSPDGSGLCEGSGADSL